MKTQTVLISGASIAGPALAFWLHQYGYQVTIIERAPAIRPGGYAVDFRGAAISVLKKMGLYDKVKEHETRAGKIALVDKNSRHLASFPDGFTSGELEIMRGDLANVLYEATRQNVTYIFDDTITGLHQHNNGVDVTFQKHASQTYDFVFGADGLHSKVRAIAFGEEAKFTHHLGLYIAIFSTPNFLKLGMDGQYYGSLGKRIGIFGANQGKEAKASFYFRSTPISYNYRDIEEQKAILHQRFENEDWHAKRLLKMMDEADDFYFDAISQIKMQSWLNGRIALLGDAAHCGSPMSGMGTSMALIGAYILAGELKNKPYPQAFSSYEEQMRPFVTNCQELASGVDWFVPNTPFKQWLSRQFWKILPYTPWKNMMIELPMKVANSITPKDY
jgi:2-polyprenyl-6-methoxyphenol hydroxylase-like FAD-dependent oxidoreductase